MKKLKKNKKNYKNDNYPVRLITLASCLKARYMVHMLTVIWHKDGALSLGIFCNSLDFCRHLETIKL